MSVVATSVFILFALIFLGFYIGKRGIMRKECAPELSNFIIRVTMPVTVFCSIAEQQGSEVFGSCAVILISAALLHLGSALLGFLTVRLLPIPDEEKGVWIYNHIFSNNGFMGFPLALAIYGSTGMLYMALCNVVSNLLIFSVGIKLLVWKYPVREKISVRRMFVNNINIAVVLGLLVCLTGVSIPPAVNQLLSYLSQITSGLSMIVVGLSLSRLPLREVLRDRKMPLLALMRLAVIPLITAAVLRLLPIQLDPTLRSVLILMAALPASSAQSMVTEQYRTNTAASGRAIFFTTLFSVVSVPLIMLLVG